MNLRDCAYYDKIEAAKIVWLELTDTSKFAYTDQGEYMLNGTYMMSGPHLFYALGILNSKLINFYFQFISNSSGMGTTQWRKYAVEALPMPSYKNCDEKLALNLETLVGQRIAVGGDQDKDLSLKLETEIDQIVYKIYGLDSADIARIEGTL